MVFSKEEFKSPDAGIENIDNKERIEKQKKIKLGQELGTLFLNAMKNTDENQIIFESNPSVAKGEIMKIGFLDYSREALKDGRPKKIQITFSKSVEDPQDPLVKKVFDTKVLMIYLDKNGKIDPTEPFMQKDLERKYLEDIRYKERLKEGKIGEGAAKEFKSDQGEWREPSIQDIKALLYPYRKDIIAERTKQEKSA